MKKRNTASWLVASLALLGVCVSCKKAQDALVKSGVDKIISDKYMALGWDTQNTTAIGKAEKTKGGNGYVQYYNSTNGKRAIYYYNDAFGLEPAIVEKYDALGQETFRNGELGKPISDTKVCGTGCTYNDFEKGILIKSRITTGAVAVSGPIYQKYTGVNRWDGVLGYPNTDELDLTSKRGRYNGFAGGQIFWSAATGAQAFWGKVESLYKSTGFDTGWLGLPTSSCTVNSSTQSVTFENGRIEMLSTTCSVFRNKNGNSTNAGVSLCITCPPPCY